MQMGIKHFGALALLAACSGGADGDSSAIHTGTQHNVTDTGTSDQAVEAVQPEAQFYVGATPDFTSYHFGRGDVQRPASKTSVGFELTGLDAWRAGDRLQLVTPNAGAVVDSPEEALAAYPGAGSTTISGQRADWKSLLAPMVDASKGDTTWVTQLVAGDGGRYSALAQAGVASGFTVRDGAPSTLAAKLAPVKQDRALTVHWKGRAFAALAGAAGTDARPGATAAIAISALPETIARTNNFFTSFYMGLPDLVEFGPISGSSDVDQTVNYGNPFATAGQPWSELISVVYTMGVPVVTPHGVATLPARIVSAQLVNAGEGVLAPALSPVRDVRLDGQLIDAPRTGIAASPELTWQAPATGHATEYAVTVHAIDARPTGVSTAPVATFHTHATSLRLPASVLTAGTYVFTITAIAAPGADLTARPLVGSLPYASADHVTAQVAR